MSVLYLPTSSKPVIEGTDATFQEIATLEAAFAGRSLNLCPRRTPEKPFPPQLLGLHRLWEIRRLEKLCRVTHIFHSVLYRFPLLRLLGNPVVYTITASLGGLVKPRKLRWLEKLRCVVVSNARDAEVLRDWGLSNYGIVPPAIDVTGIARRALPLGDEITLLMASAPWVEEQFDLKGVDVLLDLVAQTPKMRLILLWRGLLLRELHERVARRGINDRVEIVPEHAEIDDYLSRAHAAVLPAKRSDIVKAYPHSLLESLVAGKPVILSAALPMADLVNTQQCGIVLEEVSPQSLVQAVQQLRSRYGALVHAARSLDPDMFSRANMLSAYRQIYRQVAPGYF
jgi:glycosyltransferase involved in cell wall biosynthesis